MMKTTIEIDDELWRLFSIIVLRERGERKRSKVLEELIRNYINSKRSFFDLELMEAFERERKAFKRMLPRLKKRYAGMYVAVKNGEVVSAAHSKEEAATKAYKKFGYTLIYVGYVGEERVVKLPSPRVIG